MLFVHDASGAARDPLANLAQDLQVAGCSSVAILDSDGGLLARPSPTIDDYRTAVAQALRIRRLRALATNLTPAQTKELFWLEFRHDLIGEEELAKRARPLRPSAEEIAMIEARRTDQIVRRRLRSAPSLGPDVVAAEIAGLARAGRRPSASGHETFWLQVLLHAAQSGAAPLADQAFHALEQARDRATTSDAQIEHWRGLRDRARARAR